MTHDTGAQGVHVRLQMSGTLKKDGRQSVCVALYEHYRQMRRRKPGEILPNIELLKKLDIRIRDIGRPADQGNILIVEDIIQSLDFAISELKEMKEEKIRSCRLLAYYVESVLLNRFGRFIPLESVVYERLVFPKSLIDEVC